MELSEVSQNDIDWAKVAWVGGVAWSALEWVEVAWTGLE